MYSPPNRSAMPNWAQNRPMGALSQTQAATQPPMQVQGAPQNPMVSQLQGRMQNAQMGILGSLSNTLSNVGQSVLPAGPQYAQMANDVMSNAAQSYGLSPQPFPTFQNLQQPQLTPMQMQLMQSANMNPSMQPGVQTQRSMQQQPYQPISQLGAPLPQGMPTQMGVPQGAPMQQAGTRGFKLGGFAVMPHGDN